MTMFGGNGRGRLSVNGGIVVTGVKEVQRKLEKLKGRIAGNLVRRGLYAGGMVLRDEARRLVQVRTGSLKKAIVAKRADPAKGQQAVSFGIARVSFSASQVTTKRGVSKIKLTKRKGSTAGAIRPRYYAHLVELGTNRSRAFSFIVRAANNKGQAAVDAMVSKMKVDLDSELKGL